MNMHFFSLYFTRKKGYKKKSREKYSQKIRDMEKKIETFCFFLLRDIKDNLYVMNSKDGQKY